MPYIFTMTGEPVKSNDEFYDVLFAAAKAGDFEKLLQQEEGLMSAKSSLLLGFESNKYFLAMLLCVEDEGGKVPLDYLCIHQTVLDQIYQYCVRQENGSQYVDDTNAIYAVYFNQVKSLQRYLEKYPHLVDLKYDENMPRNGEFLQIAIQYHYVQLVKLLIKRGVNVEGAVTANLLNQDAEPIPVVEKFKTSLPLTFHLFPNVRVSLIQDQSDYQKTPRPGNSSQN